MHYSHPDLNRAIDFLHDFGMVEASRAENVFLRGYGEQPFIYVAEQSDDGQRHFLGGYWVVAGEADLEAAASLPGASSIRDLQAPGGGRVVTVPDPNGHIVGFVHGQTLRAESAGGGTLERNDGGQHVAPNGASSKVRKGAWRRFDPGPSPVHKLGHYGYMVPAARFKESLAWYTSTLNLKVTDCTFDPETNEDETCFLHIDLGETYTDHHVGGPGESAQDGRDVLICVKRRASSLASAKPMRRHTSITPVTKSTILTPRSWAMTISERRVGPTAGALADTSWAARSSTTGMCAPPSASSHDYYILLTPYRFDSSGNVIEHYSDGDLVNKDTPLSREKAAFESLYVWGPNVPLGFVTGKVEDAGKPIIAPPDALAGVPAQF